MCNLCWFAIGGAKDKMVQKMTEHGFTWLEISLWEARLKPGNFPEGFPFMNAKLRAKDLLAKQSTNK